MFYIQRQNRREREREKENENYISKTRYLNSPCLKQEGLDIKRKETGKPLNPTQPSMHTISFIENKYHVCDDNNYV